MSISTTTDAPPAITHDDLIVVTRWMASHTEAGASEVADVVEKPWKYRDDIALARAIRDHETQAPREHRVTETVEGDWACRDCDWTAPSTGDDTDDEPHPSSPDSDEQRDFRAAVGI